MSEINKVEMVKEMGTVKETENDILRLVSVYRQASHITIW